MQNQTKKTKIDTNGNAKRQDKTNGTNQQTGKTKRMVYNMNYKVCYK